MGKAQPFTGRLAGKTVMIHGKFGYGEKERIADIATAQQAKVVEDLDKTVDYLVLPDLTQGLTLQKKATSLNAKGAAIQVVDQAAFLPLVEPTVDQLLELLRSGPAFAAAFGKLTASGYAALHRLAMRGLRAAGLANLATTPPSTGPQIVGEKLEGLDLSGFNVRAVSFEGCSFRGSTLEGTIFGEAADCDFGNCKGQAATFGDARKSRFAGAALSQARFNALADIDFSGASLERVQLNDNQLGGFPLPGKPQAAIHCNFKGAILRGAQFRGADFDAVDFSVADLSDAVFVACKLHSANFSRATLDGATLHGTPLTGADFRNASLRNANLADAVLKDAQFDGADLDGCNLRGAKVDAAALAKARNYNPAAAPVSVVGPALKELDQLAGQAKRIHFSFRIIMDQDAEGEETSIDTSGLKYGWGLHPPGGFARFANRQRQQNQTISDAMFELAKLVGNRKVRFETIDAETTKSPKGAREICDLVIKGITEAFGIAAPPAEELAAATKAYREKTREAGAAQREEREKRKAEAEKAKAREVKKIEKSIQHQVGKVTDLATFLKALALRIEEAKIDKATKMLKKEGFQLFNDVTDTFMSGVVKSQTDADLVYACRIASDGKYACCTQNLNICGGLRGSICKHLLVLIIGLVKAEKLDPTTIDTWVAKSNQQKAELDKEVMGEIFIKYKGAEAGEVDWRPTETLPEDYYAL